MAVAMQLRLPTNFDSVSGDVVGFMETFSKGIASALLIEPERIEVVSIVRGSVIVDFNILDPPNTTPTRYASEAADRLVSLVSSRSTSSFPSELRTQMAGATVESRTTKSITAQGSGSGQPPVLAPLVLGSLPPSGCTCVGAQGEGVREGCGKHLGLGLPWCKLAKTCSAARTGSGVQSLWVYCSTTATSSAPSPSPTSSPSVEGSARGTKVASGSCGRGVAVGIVAACVVAHRLAVW